MKVGDRVKVNDDAGIHAGKEGTLIPKKDIPLRKDGSGIPDLPGHQYLLQTREVGIQEDSGNIFVMYLHRLEKISI